MATVGVKGLKCNGSSSRCALVTYVMLNVEQSSDVTRLWLGLLVLQTSPRPPRVWRRFSWKLRAILTPVRLVCYRVGNYFRWYLVSTTTALGVMPEFAAYKAAAAEVSPKSPMTVTEFWPVSRDRFPTPSSLVWRCCQSVAWKQNEVSASTQSIAVNVSSCQSVICRIKSSFPRTRRLRITQLRNCHLPVLH